MQQPNAKNRLARKNSLEESTATRAVGNLPTILPLVFLLENQSAEHIASKVQKQLSKVFQGLSHEADSGTASDENSPREGVFCRPCASMWQIGLGRRIFLYRNALGLQQLHYLLCRPGERVRVLELAELDGTRIVTNQLCSEEVLDKTALREMAERLKEVKTSIESEGQNGEIGVVAELEREQEELEKTLDTAISRYGRGRRLGDQGETLRKRICYTLKCSLTEILRRDPELGEHLCASVKTGFECSYFPRTTVRWQLKTNRNLP